MIIISHGFTLVVRFENWFYATSLIWLVKSVTLLLFFFFLFYSTLWPFFKLWHINLRNHICCHFIFLFIYTFAKFIKCLRAIRLNHFLFFLNKFFFFYHSNITFRPFSKFCHIWLIDFRGHNEFVFHLLFLIIYFCIIHRPLSKFRHINFRCHIKFISHLFFHILILCITLVKFSKFGHIRPFNFRNHIDIILFILFFRLLFVIISPVLPASLRFHAIVMCLLLFYLTSPHI